VLDTDVRTHCFIGCADVCRRAHVRDSCASQRDLADDSRWRTTVAAACGAECDDTADSGDDDAGAECGLEIEAFVALVILCVRVGRA
jgi:hypothetical protein